MSKFTTVLLGLVILSIPGFAQLSGPLSGTLGPGTYTIVGDISVEVNDSLFLEPGTIFLFNDDYEFDIYGYLFAVGNEEDSIKFMPSVSDSSWGGIDFNNSADDSSRLEYCLVTGGHATGGYPSYYGGGIYCEYCSPIISNCTISENSAGEDGGGIYCWYASPAISNCTISGNSAYWSGGGINCYNSSPTIENCTISGNSAYWSGGGINCNDSSPIIENCTISGNSVEGSGGGIYCNDSRPRIENCTISENSASCFGGGIYCDGSNPTIENCTISGNSAYYGGGICCWSNSSPIIVNTIVEGNTGNGGINFSNSPNASVTYGDFYNNENGNFTGNPPSYLGQIVNVNANGDSCDFNMNIFEDPLFVDPLNGDYHLQEDSPCIDAGDPNPQYYDPDGTIADIGAFYFHLYQVMVSLTPLNPPIIIPEGGGSFEFNIAVANNSGAPQTLDLWTVIVLPNMGYVPILSLMNFTFPPATINRDRSQVVPGYAPGGTYTYYGYLGDYPWVVDHMDSFTFFKEGSDGGHLGTPSDWICAGEPFSREDMVSIHPSEFILHPAHPNPFNPETNLTFDLPEAGNVSLVIYDVNGREIVRLVDGWRQAGVYEAAFNASSLSSGIYFARLQAGDFQQTRKLLLIK